MIRHTDILTRENTIWMQGISALMVMLMHFIMQIDGYPRFLNIFGSLGVAVFLFLSGFGLNESFKRNVLVQYWKKRFVRVIIPCWLVFLFRLPFLDKFEISQFIHNLLFFDSDLWFIDYIIRWYIVFWVSKRFFPKYTTALLFTFSFYSIFQQQFWSEQSFSFFAGYLVSCKYDKIRNIDKKKVFIYTGISVIYGIIFLLLKEIPFIRTYKGTLPFNIILLNIKLPLAMFFITLPYLLPAVKKIKVIHWCGNISYELYIVHFNFMPYITSLSLVVFYSLISFIISYVFNKINILLKSNQTLYTTLAAIVFVGVNYILITKYAMRATSFFGYITITYSLLLSIVYYLFLKRKSLISKYEKSFFWIALSLLLITMLVVQYHFDPMENKVDRWSAIANPLSALFSGDFPYLAKTHLGGNASPFPIWMIFHIPFWTLGNVGLSILFSTGIFVYSIKMLYGNDAGIKAIILLMSSICLWYETAVRSDLITNFLLLAAFINVLLYKKISFSSHLYAVSVFCGLWLSTRVSVAFPLFILLFPSWLTLSLRNKAISLVIVVFTFCLTFVPLVIWDSNSLFFAENNPFSLQSRQGRPIDSLIMLAIAVLFAFRWRGNTRLMFLFSAFMLILIPVIAYGHNMYVYDNWTSVFESAYDITYLDAAIPFCVTLIVSKLSDGAQKSQLV